MGERLELAGEAYELVETTTMERELYVQAFARRGRLDEVRRSDGESVPDFLRRAGAAVSRSPVLAQLMASRIVPAGRVWSPETGLQTAERLHAAGERRERFHLYRIAELVFQELLASGVFGQLQTEEN